MKVTLIYLNSRTHSNNSMFDFRMFNADSCKDLIGELNKKLGVSLDRDQVRDYVESG